ncbi:MAG: tetratricopeptide repeat protein [Sulfuricella sp.]|nr:tetratricopeptide repeat protein [Sulfuricella sp.]
MRAKGNITIQCGPATKELQAIANLLRDQGKKQNLTEAQMQTLVEATNIMFGEFLARVGKLDDGLAEIKRLIEEKVAPNVAAQPAAQAIEEAKAWREKYQTLLKQWQFVEGESEEDQAARTALEKLDLERAESLLKTLIQRQEKLLATMAARHYRLGQVHELQYQPLLALPQFKQAYRLQPANEDYAFRYAKALQYHEQPHKAIPILEVVVEAKRRKVNLTPSKENDLGVTLNYLAFAYSATQQHQKAEGMYEEATRIFRKLLNANPNSLVYWHNLAGALNNIASVYVDTERYHHAETTYIEARDIYRKLSEENPETFLPDVAATLNNLGVLYSDIQRYKDAEVVYNEARETYRNLTRRNPEIYLPYVAASLNNLGALFSDTQRYQEAEADYGEALKIYRELARVNPAAYIPHVAMALNNLALLYNDTQRPKAAEIAYRESLDIRRKLYLQSPSAFREKLLLSLNNLADLLKDSNTEESARLLAEAKQIAAEK